MDSTRRLAELGDRAWAEVVQEHNARVRRALDEYLGREMATLGDGFLALFDGPARAVRAAVAMSDSVAELGLRLRIGIHTGEVEIAGGQARGVAVHMAARVAAIGGADEVTHVAGTRVVASGVDVLNPAFDVTPHALVTRIVTDEGVYAPPYTFAPSSSILPPPA